MARTETEKHTIAERFTNWVVGNVSKRQLTLMLAFVVGLLAHTVFFAPALYIQAAVSTC